MATYDLLKNNDPRLKMKLESVDDDVSDRLTLQNNLLETMDKYNGLGLAANQCGIMQRAFAAYIDWPDRVKTVCFNPEIVWSSKETSFEEEGCLTYPGLFLKIRRPVAVRVTYEDVEGNISKQNFKGLESRIFQHEYDHMNGIDFTRKVSSLVLKRAKKKLINDLKKTLRKYGNT